MKKKLCDTCIYRNNVEQLKPCIIYRDDCEYYEKEGNMTKEQSIKWLKDMLKNFDLPQEQYQIALEMAIKALEQEPCEDCISREQVFKCFTWTNTKDEVYRRIQELPPVTPQPKMGRWEYVQYDNNPNIGNWHCSECRGICTEMHSIEDAYNYCPNCGAKMES